MKKDLPAIFAALDDEVRIIRSRIMVDEKIHIRPSLIIRGQLNDKPCLLVRSGVGKKAMQGAVNYCLKHYHVTSCLNVGYAGGTTPELSAGDLLLADPVVDGEKKVSFAADSALADKAQSVTQQSELKLVRGGLVTVNKVVDTPHEKAFIGTEHEALAVDMESSAFMAGCQAASKPSLVVRAILDPLDITLPDMSDALDESGKLSLGQVAGHVISHPKDLLSFPKIEYCAIKARESMATFIEAWVKAL